MTVFSNCSFYRIILASAVGLLTAVSAHGHSEQPTQSTSGASRSAEPSSAQIYDHVIEAKLYERYLALKKYDDPGITRKDIEFFIPHRMRPTGDLDIVQEQVIYHTAQNALKKLRRGNNILGRTVNKVSQTVNADLNFQAKTGTEGSGDQVTHEFNVDMELWSGQAKVTYKGFVDASLIYTVDHDIMSIYITEKLTNSLSLQLAHQERPNRHRYDRVTLKWVF